MQRRDFCAGSMVGAVGSFLIQSDVFAQEIGSATQVSDIKKMFNLASPYNSSLIQDAYTPSRKPTAAPLPPQVFLYYERDANPPTFVSPTDMKPVLEAGKYELNFTLNAFNIAKAYYSNFSNLKQDLQLGVNVAAPSSGGQDKLTWLFMNAVDVFLQKPSDVPAQLSKFKNYSPTADLKPSSKISISEGVVDLQVTAFGQKKDGFWKKLFDLAAKVLDSPLFAAFAIPSLVKESVDFVDKSLDVLAAQDKLIPLWETHPLTFGVDKSASNKVFYLKPGYWVTVDTNFAKQNDYLEKGFSLDFKAQSFQILSGIGNQATPVDANYLVTYLDISKSKT